MSGLPVDGIGAAADTARGWLISRNGNRMPRFDELLDPRIRWRVCRARWRLLFGPRLRRTWPSIFRLPSGAAGHSEVLRPTRSARAGQHLASECYGKTGGTVRNPSLPFLGNRAAIEPPRTTATVSLMGA
jgi:hypothetical protein